LNKNHQRMKQEEGRNGGRIERDLSEVNIKAMSGG
jgi:hypothetical protein